MNQQLPDYGYITGLCATAAAKGAIRMLRDQQRHDQVEILQPTGETGRFLLQGQHFDSRSARCFVVKESDSTADVTHGAEIHAFITLEPAQEGRVITIRGGQVVYHLATPGLSLPVGKWAISPITRRMIKEAVTEAFPLSCPLLSQLQAPAVPQITIKVLLAGYRGEMLYFR